MQLNLEDDDIVVDASHRWVSSPRYFNRLKKIKIDHYSGQTTNQAYLLGMPMISNAKLADIIGPFGKSTQIPSNQLPGASLNAPTTDTSPGDDRFTDVFGGNLNNVLLGRWGGIEIEDDAGKGRGFTSDHIYMKLRLYADVAIRQERAIIVCPDALARD